MFLELPFLILLLAAHAIHGYPLMTANFLFNSRADKNWWVWAWGAESTVSIVDRSPTVSYPSRPAVFGVEISGPILGYVIPLSSFTSPCSSGNETQFGPMPNDGCPRLCVNGPHQPDPTESWIALVQRGKCEFVSKVREAQRLGARAVVVGGQDPEVSGLPDTLVNMFSPDDSTDVTIAATFIKYSDYSELSSLIATSNTSHSGLRTLSLLITADYSAWDWYSPILTFVVILLLPSILTFITIFVHRIRAARAAQRDRAPEDIVRNLPWRIWTGTGWEKHEGGEQVTSLASPNADPEQTLPAAEESTSRNPEPEVVEPLNEDEEADPGTSTKPQASAWFENQFDCAICLCEFVKGDKVRVLPCHHIFHMEEVDEWLIQRKKLCPICKADVTQSGSLGPSESTDPSTPAAEGVDQAENVLDERTPLLGATSNPTNYSDGSPPPV
ncbi:hypothetical protein C8J56DRAFT_911488 [Mycena floridula]|nr:hypothetical protein C8J56DRAFT_911488 [Mycena floridula]